MKHLIARFEIAQFGIALTLSMMAQQPAAAQSSASATTATTIAATAYPVQPWPTNRPLNDPLLRSRGSWGQDYRDLWGAYAIGLLQDDGTPTAALSAALQPVTLALIDTGVDYTHPDLPTERLWRNPDDPPNGRDDDHNGLIDDVIGWNFVTGNNNPWDDHGHGTHVAGVIAAAADNGAGIAGIAPNARLMVLKALDSSGHGNGSDIAHAVRYAVDKGARIIHLSLGGEPPSVAELEALGYALARDVLVVTAAGNQASEARDQGYELLDDLLVVGALTPEGERARFSNWGGSLDLMAPGVEILSLRARGSDFLRRNGVAGYRPGSAWVGEHYYRATGNSFAAPHVSAAAALLLGRIPTLTPTQLQRTLMQSARDLGPPGTDHQYGYGALDLKAALAADPRWFVEANLSDAELDRSRNLILYGTADADQFQSAWLEIGQGEQPAEWQPLGAPLSQPIEQEALIQVSDAELPNWSLLNLRLITEHRDGTRRESRLLLQRSTGGAP